MAKKEEWRSEYDPAPTYSIRGLDLRTKVIERILFRCPKCEFEIDRFLSDEVVAEDLFKIHLKDEHDLTIEEI